MNDQKFSKKIDVDKIQCLVCPRKCILKNQQLGHCQARKNSDGQITPLTYARPCGLSMDPIEKKPLYHFYPGSSILSFGTFGCNLDCHFCQNHHLSNPPPDHYKTTPVTNPTDIIQLAKNYHTKLVAFTYNEPIIFFEFAQSVSRHAKIADIKTVAVSNGYISDEARPGFFSFLDAANIDLKSFSEAFYKQYCNAHLEPVLETLKYVVKNTKVWTEITTLIIPGLNDSTKELEKMTDWIANNLGAHVPLHFSAFHPAHKMLNHQMTPPTTLKKAREIALKNGLQYVYTGNIQNPAGQHTYCHNCHQIIIERENYLIKQLHLNSSGLCTFCQTQCAGVFN
ncbi:MAG: AmmeMemoRadiSam system radical SAM enzyme [Bdellovibrionales bacterium RIFOXYB1_FULL_37_110]|nr:MAG: AmmeMemoRadiSam system radical SAM enzyme [Bdellovibrionales bacterium RIFOXYC1_FULL_37_79]OFZ59309.1 MAG: AmmeMemoRadiSam system radical SAM enzyme [Bdellovibrionales bacterium RIFOXYB1_FULL_37_110]OFZ62935.1 MAG: AmmeMemoRadiSam system radical SAM enzyme [Bdellovibrionales bacterium RIFOXYD1_FULL_36_51]